jgi:hypothetical protein
MAILFLNNIFFYNFIFYSGENEEEVLKNIESPQLMMPARTDSPNVRTVSNKY